MNTAIETRRSFHWKAFLFFEGITLLIGFLGGLLGGSTGFADLVKPPLTPPAIVFPIVWTVLYLLMGFAAYLVWDANDIDSGKALRIYFVQLFVNALWTFFYFRLEWRLFGFFWLLLLVVLVALTMNSFRYISKTAFWLMVPYFVWLLFAAYLNLATYLLNA